MNASRRARGVRPVAAATIVASALLATRASDVAAAIVECVDARGVSVLTTDAGGGGCGPKLSVTAPRRASPSNTVATATPVGFPRVSETMQRSRDSDRARILRDELGSEENRLAALQALSPASAAAIDANARLSGATSADVAALMARTRENIRALQQELTGLPSH